MGPGTGTLFVVATPIGNLEDITLRALRVLKEVDVVAAEDTRRTSRLLTHYGISTKLISVHEHNERARVPKLVQSLMDGRSVALVTDAGTPGASDPGMPLVRAAREQGIPVIPIPGPSAVIAALSVAGAPFDRFVFAGFPPVRSKDRKRWFREVAAATTAVVFFEAPHRVRRTIDELAHDLADRPITACRELTKLHEEVLSGRVGDILQQIGEPRGEFTFVLGPSEAGPPSTTPSDLIDIEQRVAFELGQTANFGFGMSRRDRLRGVAERLGLKVSEVYQVAERLKNKANNQ